MRKEEGEAKDEGAGSYIHEEAVKVENRLEIF